MGLLEELSFNELTERFERIGIAYSGGLDSTVLLHLIANRIESKEKINALHINHSISPDSDNWEEFCNENAKSLGVQFSSYKLNKLQDPSEDDLRKIRYEKFKEWANNKDLILTAHHKDDQVETIFFRILRGTGLHGLKGIPEWRKDRYINYHRPLLGFSKKQLREYADANKLQWIEDESNKDISISRNFIRNNLIPKINEKWPNVEKSILHLSSEATKSNNILRSVAKEDLEKISSKKNYYDFNKYLALPSERADNLLYFLINHELDLEANSSYLKEIKKSLSHSNNLDNIAFPLTDSKNRKLYKLRVLDGEICILSEGEFDALDSSYISNWDLSSRLEIPSGSLTTEKVNGKGIDVLYLDQKIHVKGRSGGERCRPFGRNKSQKLKKLFQEYEIPLWQRDRMPLIYIGGKLAAVGDLWVCDEFHAKQDSKGISIDWTDNLIN